MPATVRAPDAPPPKAWGSALDRWLPAELLASPATRIRARVALVFPVLYVVFTSIVAVAHLLRGGWLTSALMMATVPLMALAPWILLRTRSLERTANASAMVIFTLIGVTAWLQWGTSSRTLMWFGVAVLYALLVGGARSATRWLGVSLVVTLGLYGLQVAGFPFPKLGPKRSALVDMIELLMLTGGTFTIAIVYQQVNASVLAELARASVALTHIREGLDDAQRLARVGSWEVDVLTEQASWSDTLHELFMRPPGPPVTVEEALGFVHPEDRASLAGWYQELRRTGTPGEAYARIVRADGEVRVLHWLFSSSRSAEGRLVSVAGTAQDVTEARRAEAALVRAREEALFASAAKSQFLSHMSHEIRTPMNGVIGMTTLALGTALDDEQREYIQSARTSALHLLTIIGDILDLTKVEAGELVVEQIPLSLVRILGEAADTVSWSAQQKGVAVFVDVAADLPSAMLGDPVRLRQIVLNLAGNAVKFTEVGSVTLRAGWDPDVPGSVRLVVEDTGPGIPEDAQGRIFDSFQQADASTTRRFGGTGLGLTISRKLAELMSGRIWVESTLGVGSRFSLQLPLVPVPVAASRPAEAPPAAAPAPSDPGPPLRVLLAEDCAVSARVAQRLLERAGHHVVHVANGRDAVRVALSEPVDLVLMDLQMPEIDGLGATRLIREHEDEHGGHLPVVALTANAMKGDEATCLAARIDAYLSKPVDAERLLAVVRTAAERGVPRFGPALTSQERASAHG